MKKSILATMIAATMMTQPVFASPNIEPENVFIVDENNMDVSDDTQFVLGVGDVQLKDQLLGHLVEEGHIESLDGIDLERVLAGGSKSNDPRYYGGGGFGTIADLGRDSGTIGTSYDATGQPIVLDYYGFDFGMYGVDPESLVDYDMYSKMIYTYFGDYTSDRIYTYYDEVNKKWVDVEPEVQMMLKAFRWVSGEQPEELTLQGIGGLADNEMTYGELAYLFRRGNEVNTSWGSLLYSAPRYKISGEDAKSINSTYGMYGDDWDNALENLYFYNLATAKPDEQVQLIDLFFLINQVSGRNAHLIDYSDNLTWAGTYHEHIAPKIQFCKDVIFSPLEGDLAFGVLPSTSANKNVAYTSFNSFKGKDEMWNAEKVGYLNDTMYRTLMNYDVDSVFEFTEAEIARMKESATDPDIIWNDVDDYDFWEYNFRYKNRHTLDYPYIVFGQ